MALKRNRELDGGWSRDYEGVEALAMNDCIRLLSRIDKPVTPHTFKCKSCDRCFDSFQALGGHTASHSAKPGDSPKNQKIHKCSICKDEFGSGQALGGHMRKHRKTEPGEIEDTMSSDSTERDDVALWNVSASNKIISSKRAQDLDLSMKLLPMEKENYLDENYHVEEDNCPDENNSQLRRGDFEFKCLKLEERDRGLQERDVNVKFYQFM